MIVAARITAFFLWLLVSGTAFYLIWVEWDVSTPVKVLASAFAVFGTTVICSMVGERFIRLTRK